MQMKKDKAFPDEVQKQIRKETNEMTKCDIK